MDKNSKEYGEGGEGTEAERKRTNLPIYLSHFFFLLLLYMYPSLCPRVPMCSCVS